MLMVDLLAYHTAPVDRVLTITLVDVDRSRLDDVPSISDQISFDFNLRHESPQLLVVKCGRVTYHDSHFGIDYQKLLNYFEMSSKGKDT